MTLGSILRSAICTCDLNLSRRSVAQPSLANNPPKCLFPRYQSSHFLVRSVVSYPSLTYHFSFLSPPSPSCSPSTGPASLTPAPTTMLPSRCSSPPPPTTTWLTLLVLYQINDLIRYSQVFNLLPIEYQRRAPMSIPLLPEDVWRGVRDIRYFPVHKPQEVGKICRHREMSERPL